MPQPAHPQSASLRPLGGRWWLALALACCSAGCATYQIGTRSLYPPDIDTVFVPIFESDSFRRGLGERLTEAVMKEIERKTPYKVVGSPNADSVLTGRILTDTKGVTVSTPTAEPRALLVTFTVEVAWVDRRGDLIRTPTSIAVPEALVDVMQTANLYPEVGQSITTSQQQAIQRMAEQIVGLMEVPW